MKKFLIPYILLNFERGPECPQVIAISPRASLEESLWLSSTDHHGR
ncbi:hypothetical protein ABOONEI_2886 [Aciduliprofundum boonei T469]|nr:hypothetical protein ABOONEI_2886 [Aciduliprofundum boonei T469]